MNNKILLFIFLTLLTIFVLFSCTDSKPLLLGDYTLPYYESKSDIKDVYNIKDICNDSLTVYKDVNIIDSTVILDSNIKDSAIIRDVSQDINWDGFGNDVNSEENGIYYHGGPILTGTVNVYYIWYGDWSNKTYSKAIMCDFINNFGGSSYYEINTTYYSIVSDKMTTTSSNVNIFSKLKHLRTINSPPEYDEQLMQNFAPRSFKGNKVNVNNSVKFIKSVSDEYSLGKDLTQMDIFRIVVNKILKQELPLDYNGAYFVLTSEDVNQYYFNQEFCKGFCGWHSFGTYNGVNVKYSFVGDTNKCPRSCSIFPMKDHSATEYWTPNDDITADGMVSVIAHELEEITSDPELSAWFDKQGWENADKCAWQYGDTYKVNNSIANMKLGERHYLVQQNWVNAKGGYCASKL